jgi:hypothetical protein
MLARALQKPLPSQSIAPCDRPWMEGDMVEEKNDKSKGKYPETYELILSYPEYGRQDF